jgi:hypothetical protein
MNELITQVGVGGVLAILIIREVLNARNHRKNGEYISRSEFEKHKDSVQYKDSCEQIVKRIDAAFEKIDEQFENVKELIRNGGK